MQYIDLQRRFHTLTEAKLEDAELLADLSEDEFRLSPSIIDWSRLLQYARVILLAAAGAGKTREMEEQANRLVREDQFAFFVPLESLNREESVDLLLADEEERFEAWKADGDAPAWFFLDAVDELKLTEGKLDRALRRLSRALTGHLARARIIISCRPSDWRPSVDLATVRNRLPVPERGGNIPSQSSETAFLDALRRDQGRAPLVCPQEEDRSRPEVVQTVMLPMSGSQIVRFAKQSGVDDADAFLNEITQQNAWTFARRPLDLTQLIATWASSGRLGTRAEQHEANVTAKLKDDPERPDRHVLAYTQARLGAERLALALALTRTRTIRAPEQALGIHRAEGVLDAASILPDWTEEQRKTLLRQALFDLATYGLVRFHHRSVQEYLAACHLWRLREKGMPTSVLFRLLFAERYGVAVVIPSMRTIAAWLALWDNPVRKKLTAREPEALLSLGDPETLNLSARSALVRAFVSKYGQGGRRGLNIPVDEMRRLAHPELAPVIRECWGNGPANDDVRTLLIKMVWLGAVKDCADLAQTAALDTTGDPNQRVIVIHALLACGQNDTVHELVDGLLTQSTSWPDRVVHGIAADLFPKFISVSGLITLMERTPEPERTVGGFGGATRQIVEAIEPRADSAGALRDNMADLIWRGREQPGKISDTRSEFGHLASALAMLCDRQLAQDSDRASADLIRACVIASRFCGDAWDRTPVNTLKAHFRTDSTLRNATFWAELAFVDEVVPAQDDWRRLSRAQSDSLIELLTEADRPWLETALADESRPERRAVALHALIRFWHQRGEVVAELDTLHAALNGDTMLDQLLTELTAPPERDERVERMERETQSEQSAQTRSEEQRLENWRQWRADLLANPAAAFSPENQATTVSHLYSWLEAFHQGRNRFNIWDKNALTGAFGRDIANRTEVAFRAWWRANPPILWSAQPSARRNQVPHTWIYGLLGVSAEALTPEWTASLSPEEARTAAAYATIELNDFAPFIVDLARSHPAEVDAVIGGELSAELRVGADHDYLSTLNNLPHTEDHLKQLMAPRLFTALQVWPSAFTDETGPRLARHLDQVLRILGDTSSETDRAAIAEECATRYEADPSGALALTWLKGLFRFDAEHGTQALIGGLGDSNDPGRQERAIASFAGLFGGHDGVFFEIPDPTRRARALGHLVRCAYACIRPENDSVHEGVYSPDTRDEAENARSFLLSMLLDTPGPEARRIVLALAAEDDFADFSDRLRLLARQRTSADAEFDAFSPEAVIAIESRYEAPPHDRDGLFTVMQDRLEDLAYDLAHHDFTDRETLQGITHEKQMQRTLAWRLDEKANGAYRVTREEEVADQKQPDIRLLAVKGDQKAAIEVKIADKWTLTQLERALRDQLVGQYLRDANCKAGCLLLTYQGRKQYWEHPDTKKRLYFPEMVTFLKDKARTLTEECLHDIRITVFGLDLTAPPLAAAH